MHSFVPCIRARFATQVLFTKFERLQLSFKFFCSV